MKTFIVTYKSHDGETFNSQIEATSFNRAYDIVCGSEVVNEIISIIRLDSEL